MADDEFLDIDGADGWCCECGYAFHLDDIGGYNPPCVCGVHCRSCHAVARRDTDEDCATLEHHYCKGCGNLKSACNCPTLDVTDAGTDQ